MIGRSCTFKGNLTWHWLLAFQTGTRRALDQGAIKGPADLIKLFATRQRPPMHPDRFKTEVAKRTFTNGADQGIVTALYRFVAGCQLVYTST